MLAAILRTQPRHILHWVMKITEGAQEDPFAP